jgi:hypothetical protein
VDVRWDSLVGGYRDHYEDQDKGDQDFHKSAVRYPTPSEECGREEGYLSRQTAKGDSGVDGPRLPYTNCAPTYMGTYCTYELITGGEARIIHV